MKRIYSTYLHEIKCNAYRKGIIDILMSLAILSKIISISEWIVEYNVYSTYAFYNVLVMYFKLFVISFG